MRDYDREISALSRRGYQAELYVEKVDSLQITKEMEEYKFYLVAEKLYHYAWHTFADVIIERTKEKRAAGGASAESAQQLLLEILPLLLKSLHPFMPFLTEELWAHLGRDTMIMVEPWTA